MSNRLAFNKVIDKNKYEILEESTKNLLIIKYKNNDNIKINTRKNN
jgi:hypothetical protein